MDRVLCCDDWRRNSLDIIHFAVEMDWSVVIIWLVDFDGKMENLALMRLSTWHKQRGDTVRLKFGDTRPELFEQPDKVYISCLFRWHKRAALALAEAWNSKAEIGGTGVDIAKELPPEVAACPPDYDLYGNSRAIGFISRGCPNHCPWCVVWRKEGELHRVSTANELVNNHPEATFLDNNFLALPDHCVDLRWLVEQQIGVDFNQGLDARLITEENAKLLAQCRWITPGHQTVRLALDSVGQIQAVGHALDLLESAGLAAWKISIYALIGYSGLNSDIERLLFLRSRNVSVFPMGFRDLETGLEPARGWNRRRYKKYRRLICRMPHAQSVWDDFKREVCFSPGR